MFSSYLQVAAKVGGESKMCRLPGKLSLEKIQNSNLSFNFFIFGKSTPHTHQPIT